jgi:hypothetical protein
VALGVSVAVASVTAGWPIGRSGGRGAPTSAGVGVSNRPRVGAGTTAGDSPVGATVGGAEGAAVGVTVAGCRNGSRCGVAAFCGDTAGSERFGGAGLPCGVADATDP